MLRHMAIILRKCRAHFFLKTKSATENVKPHHGNNFAQMPHTHFSKLKMLCHMAIILHKCRTHTLFKAENVMPHGNNFAQMPHTHFSQN
jgi:hypothetical protein